MFLLSSAFGCFFLGSCLDFGIVTGEGSTDSPEISGKSAGNSWNHSGKFRGHSKIKKHIGNIHCLNDDMEQVVQLSLHWLIED